MLTPLGAGGTRTRRRRRWPRVLAVLLALAVVVGAGVGAWWWFTQRDDTSATPPPSTTRTCTTPTPKAPAKLPEPAAVTVSVGNGTDRTGLAISTADTLAARGFEVASVGNTDAPVKSGVAVVRYRQQDVAAAVLVASYLPGAELTPVKRVADADVVVWLGPDFDQVATTSQADPEAVALPPGEPRCHS